MSHAQLMEREFEENLCSELAERGWLYEDDGNTRRYATGGQSSRQEVVVQSPAQGSGEVGVRIGAAYGLRIGSIACTLSFELAASLTIWGPPFAGEAYVDLGIFAVTIPIGGT